MPMLVMSLLFCLTGQLKAQEKNRDLIKDSQLLVNKANQEMEQDLFVSAEAKYRKAASLDPKNNTAKYNMGNAYYSKSKNLEAMRRFKESSEVANTRPQKHQSFHNFGNTLMNEKKYAEAVEIYKNALRNNPEDDETRYNLALAKKMLEKEKNGGGGKDKDKEKEDQDQKDKDQKDEDKKDKGKEKDSDKGEDKEEEKEDGKDKEKEKEGDDKDDKGKPKDKKGDKEQPKDKKKQQQPKPGQLSPQQIKSLLEAMNNEEKKVQNKVNAKKVKGAKTKTEKDW